MGHFVSSPRERKKREKIVEEMKERDREERGKGMKVKKQKKLKHSPSTLTCYKDSKPCPNESQYQLDARVQKLLTFFSAKNINVFAIFPDRNLNGTLANNFLKF